MKKILPLVSVVVTTKEEEIHIKDCLKSIKAQTYAPIETIVIDNNSIDKTKEIARMYTSNVFNIGPERSVQRNEGMINKSSGTYVMFVDADMLLEPDLIDDCVSQIQQTNSDALHIPEVILGKKFFSRVRNFERSFYSGTSIDGTRFFKKDAFIKVEGFDESFRGPEDWDLDLKLKKAGMKIHRLTGTYINHNEAEFNLKKYLDKKSYYAKDFDKYINKWGSNHPAIQKQFGLYYRLIGVFIEKGKWRKLLRHPILTLGMLYLRLRVGLRFLTRNKTQEVNPYGS